MSRIHLYKILKRKQSFCYYCANLWVVKAGVCSKQSSSNDVSSEGISVYSCSKWPNSETRRKHDNHINGDNGAYFQTFTPQRYS